MRFAALFAGVAMVASAFAQSTKIAFTTVPSSVQAGQATTIAWGGGDGTPVTILLKAGDPKSLITISTIVENANGNTFTWTPPATLQNRNDYALQITQGLTGINYSGQFPYSGGVASVASSATSSAASTGSAVATTTAFNSTAIATTTLFVGGSSSGTGSALPRNTTFSGATLTTTTAVSVTSVITTITGTRTAAPSSSSSAGAGAIFGPAPLGVGLLGMVLYWL